MSVSISQQQYNWMGHGGTETELVDNSLFRADQGTNPNLDYAHRQIVTEDMKERLYLIKRDLDLIPEEELRAEEEARQRRHQERERRRAEEERLVVERERQRKEQEIAQAKREQQLLEDQRAAAEYATRWKALAHSDSDIDTDDENEILSRVKRTPAELKQAAEHFTKGARCLLIQRAAIYVSYLDGSVHTTLTGLTEHNHTQRSAIEAAAQDTGATLPDAAAFDTHELQAALQRRNAARQKLDAYRCELDPSYAARLPATEKDSQNKSLVSVGVEDGDESSLLRKVKDTKQALHDARAAYNERATASSKFLTAAISSKAALHIDAEVPSAAVEAESITPINDASFHPAESNGSVSPAAVKSSADVEIEEAAPLSVTHSSVARSTSERLAA